MSAKQIKDFADYVLIGHSERRTNFSEYQDLLGKKVEISLKYGLKPVFLVQTKDDEIPQGVSIVAYEPVFAIGSNTPDTPENADAIAAYIKTKNNCQVLYGGSVTPENVKKFTAKTSLEGVVVGGASLDALELLRIIQNA